mgnify:CR=1 FL=1
MSRSKLVITWIVTIVWAAAYAKNIARGDNVPPEITAPFVVVLGWLSGSSITKEGGVLQRVLEAIRSTPPAASDTKKPKRRDLDDQ